MRMLPFWVILLSLLFTLACGKSSHEKQAEVVPLEQPKGFLQMQLDEIYTSPWLTTCETKNQSAVAEMLNSLDSRAPQIKGYAESPADNEYFRRIKIGPLWLRDMKEKTNPINIWETEKEYGWQDLLTTYRKIAATPVDGLWAGLYKNTQFILTLEYSRLVYDTNLQLNKDSGALLLAAIAQVSQCLSAAQCTEVSFDPPTKQFIQNNTVFSSFLGTSDNISDQKTRRQLLTDLKARLNYDYKQQFAFAPSRAVSRVSPSEFRITMDSGDFKGLEKELEELVLPYWKSANYKVSIKWTSLTPTVRWEIRNGLFGRAFTDSKRIVLFNNTRKKSLPHEFGHALGLRDKYFFIWKQNECDYQLQSNSAEIMSDVQPGSVTDEDWKELDQAYPYIAPATH